MPDDEPVTSALGLSCGFIFISPKRGSETLAAKEKEFLVVLLGADPKVLVSTLSS